MEKEYPKMMLLFIGSNTSSRAQNPISTIQIVAIWVLNLFSKFQLDQTIDEVGSACWWNLGKCVVFFLSLLFYLFFFFPIYFIFCFCFLNVTDLGPKHMGPTPSHKREPKKSPIPDYVRGSTKPACFLQNCSFSMGIGFVIIFDLFSSIWIFSRQNNFISNASQIQWYPTSICLDLKWKVGFLLRWITLGLSQ